MTPANASSTTCGTSRLTHGVLFLLCGFLIVLAAAQFAFGTTLSGESAFTDIHAYYAAGRMYWAGQLADAYNAVKMLEAQQQMFGAQSVMPWTYPPQFNLLTVALAKLPLPLAYLLFIVSTFASYVFFLRRLTPQHYGYVLTVIFPAIMITIACGQSGFLVGGLAAAFCGLMLKRRALAGIPLGLLAIKPHLCVGIGLIVLLTGSWRVITTALVTLLLLVTISTFLFGIDIWAAFLDGATEAGAFLRQGLYPLYRMVSVYAGLVTMGAPARIALLVQGAVALMALALVTAAWLRRWPPNQVLAVATITSLLVSPYAYDYDVTLIGVGLALVAREILSGAKTWEKNLIVALGGFAAGVGVLQTALQQSSSDGTELVTGSTVPAVSLGWIGLVLLLILIVRTIRRRPAQEASGYWSAAQSPGA